MSDDRQKLKALLLSEEIAQIKALHDLLNDKQQLSQKVSEVLDPATDLAIAKNPQFQKKFSKINPKSFVKAIKANKQTFIDALLPIIGPMIRKSVSSAIRKFVADVNRAVEMGFSAKALKWRWQALRTGVPFAEIVFNNTIEYQVDQVFLIDNHSGLLIEHAGHEESLLQDKEAMSAMLTVIQDFVKDSVSKDGGSLSAAELGDNLVWIINGNKANIAAVIKGAPTQRLRDTILAVLEEIHIEYHRQLDDQSTWNNSPEIKSEIESLLLTKSQSDEEKPKGMNIWPWLILFLIPVIWYLWSSYQHHSEQQEVTQKLNQTSGFVLTELSHDNGQFIASGLLDPLAKLPEFDDNVIINSTPFISLDDNILSQRIKNSIDITGVDVVSENSEISIKGEVANPDSFQQKLNLIRMLPGVSKVTDLTTIKHIENLEVFLINNPPPDTLVVNQSEDQLKLTGTTTTERLKAYSAQIEKFGKVNSEQVELLSISKLENFISDNQLILDNPELLNDHQMAHLAKLVTTFQQLKTIKNGAKLQLFANSDCQGSQIKSNQFNQLRLNLVKNYFYKHGINKEDIMAKSIECNYTSNDVDLLKIGVWFEVLK